MVVVSSVFITLRCYKKFATSNYYNLDITDVQFLGTVKDNNIHKISITIPSEDLYDSAGADGEENYEANNNAEDLNTLISSKRGPTELYINIVDSETGKMLSLKSRDTITVTNDLIMYINQKDRWEYSIN